MAKKKKSHTDVLNESGNTDSEANNKIFTFEAIPELVVTANFASATATGVLISAVGLRITGSFSVACYAIIGSFGHVFGANLLGYELSISGLKAKFGFMNWAANALRAKTNALTTQAGSVRSDVNGLALYT